MRRVAILLALAAFAGGGGQSSTLTVAPSSPTLGSQFTLSGCGYHGSISVEAGPDGTGILYYQLVNADSNGCVAASFTANRVGGWHGYTFATPSYHEITEVAFTVS